MKISSICNVEKQIPFFLRFFYMKYWVVVKLSPLIILLVGLRNIWIVPEHAAHMLPIHLHPKPVVVLKRVIFKNHPGDTEGNCQSTMSMIIVAFQTF